MAPVKTIRNILMELRKICQHPYLSAPDLEPLEAPDDEQQRQLISSSGKLQLLKLLLPKLKERGHRVLLFSQFKIALDRIEDFLYGEGIKFLRLDGDVQQAQRQKSMDLFNAPNSEYDVFLLTTRAGGVGINLATADTVIIYDPDFNPHQDLQAIARSHRYGQKKKVLVFKLMVKGSVEENIINKGKKKMVLDHLVVQQMGKENEEGDIDDLLLRGAEAVYTNQGGINVPDIVYNSKNVDELIDRVEADADAEAKEMEEREKRIANGEIEPAQSRQAAQFGFAKIWEADQNELLAIAEEEAEEEANRPEINWEQIIEAMEKEKQAKKAELMEGQRAKRIRKAAGKQYSTVGSLDEPSPERKKRLKNKGKGKGIESVAGAGHTSSSDAEFTLRPEDAASDDDEVSVSSVPEGLSGLATDDNGHPIPGGLAGPQKMSKKHKMMIEAAKALQSSGTAQNGATVPLPLPALPLPGRHLGGPSNVKRANEDAMDEAARKRRRQELLPVTGHDTNPGADREFAAAHQILTWLYSILREFGQEGDIRRWGMMALPEMPAESRAKRYRRLAGNTDDRLQSLGQDRYFSQREQIDTVMPLFTAQASAIPSVPTRPPQYPPTAGLDRRVPAVPLRYSRTAGLDVPALAPQVARIPRRVAGAAAQAVPSPTISNGVHRAPDGTGLFDGLMNSAPPSCVFCRRQHDIAECTSLPSLADLERIKQTILSRSDTPTQKEVAMQNVNQTFQFLVKLGRIPQSYAATNPFGLTARDFEHARMNEPYSGPSDPGHAPVVNHPNANGHLAAPPQVISVASTPSPALAPAATASSNGHHLQRPPHRLLGAEAGSPPCGFCNTHCGRDIKGCADRHGGRKKLKDLIRVLQEMIEGGDGRAHVRDRQRSLYAVYSANMRARVTFAPGKKELERQARAVRKGQSRGRDYRTFRR